LTRPPDAPTRAPGRPRVLLIAEAANPEWTSVPLEGWCHSQALARLAELHLVTHRRNEPAILRAGLEPGKDFTPLPPAPLARALWRLVSRLRGGDNRAWTLVTAYESLLYYVFELRVWRRFGDALRGGGFDLVHRLTPLTPTAQSPLAGWCRRVGVPFTLGPLNGGLPWPPEFRRELHRERDYLVYLRRVMKALPGYRATRRNAAAIVAGSRATFAELPAWARAKTVYVPENGLLPERFTRSVERAAGLPLRVAFVGRLVPYKGADLLLEAALPLVRAGRVVVDVIGDGPELGRLRSLASEPGVRFAGFVPHERLQDRLVESDVLGFPSVREFGGAVVLEAMALGLAPVVVDYGGPGEHVTAATGIALPLQPRPALVEGLRGALEQLAADPGRVREMGRRARTRVMERYTWEAKARQLLEVWRFALGQRDKPDFGMPLADP
jgi:starch synthase